MKFYQAVQKLLLGDTDRHMDRQTGDLISLLNFLESRLKITIGHLMQKQRRFQRRTTGYTKLDKKRNTEILREVKINSVLKHIDQYRNYSEKLKKKVLLVPAVFHGTSDTCY
jgi:hypothetical protein